MNTKLLRIEVNDTQVEDSPIRATDKIRILTNLRGGMQGGVSHNQGTLDTWVVRNNSKPLDADKKEDRMAIEENEKEA